MFYIVGGDGAQCSAGQLTVWAGRSGQPMSTVSLYLASHHQSAAEKGASAADAAVPGLVGWEEGGLRFISCYQYISTS